MNKLIKNTFLLCAAVLAVGSVHAQVKDYKVVPDFDYNDYSQSMKYMIQPFALTGQTLYLENVNDTLLDYFYTGVTAQEHAKKQKTKQKSTRTGKRDVEDAFAAASNAKNNVRFRGKDISYYYLTRMTKEKLNTLKGAWFVVLDYVPDQFAFNRVADAAPGKQDWTKLRYPFLKLLVGNTEDTVFYAYQNFYNEYHFPFTPMSYYNRNKNGYPVGKYSNSDLNLIHYDTNANYAIVPDQLIGQKLTLPVVTDATLERLFNGIRLYNYSDDSRKYSFTDYPIAKARRLEGQTFEVKDVAFDASSLTNVYLKLVIPGRTDTIYYKYPTKEERRLFPFVIETYLARLKKEYKDREFTVRGDKFPLTVIDLRRKRPLTLHQGDIFRCLDVVVKDGKFQMLMRNEKGRKFYMPEDYALGDWLSFEKYLMDNSVEKYRNTFPTYYKAICNKELLQGMTMDMVSQSWGKPDREVFTNFDGSDRHWFYMGNIYVIFKNNKLFRVAMIPKELR
ncbi:MAG: hypothetical protein J6M30_05360 [Bacteroidales bacterium]|nr:hypothetical protein [Bacteroidales bacterium]